MLACRIFDGRFLLVNEIDYGFACRPKWVDWREKSQKQPKLQIITFYGLSQGTSFYATPVIKGIGQLMMSNQPNSACCSVSSTLHCDFRFSLVLHFLVRLFFIYFSLSNSRCKFFVWQAGFLSKLTDLPELELLSVERTQNAVRSRRRFKADWIETRVENEKMRELGLPVPSLQKRALRDIKSSYIFMMICTLKDVQ